MTKIYGIYGVRQAVIQIPVGDGAAYLMKEFSKGNPQSGPYYRPATCVVTSRTEQLMIESSRLFGNKIVIYRQFGEETEAPAGSKKGAIPTGNSATLKYEDVTTREQMLVVLKKLGAKAAVLASDDAIRAFIDKKNISFPNFTF